MVLATAELSTMKLRKIAKFFIGIALLPLAAALTTTMYNLILSLPWRPQTSFLHAPWLPFAAGYVSWLAVFAILPPPMRAYVLGHELTHALWAWLMGARVSGLRVRKTGGQVLTSKSNWLITLAPYFFPFYAMLFIAIFYAAAFFWPNGMRFLWVLYFFVGVGWSFHITFTVAMLTIRQPDIEQNGWVFSMIAIYCMNLLVIALTFIVLSGEISLGKFASTLARETVEAYAGTISLFTSAR
jgi:hypothetical protein